MRLSSRQNDCNQFEFDQFEDEFLSIKLTYCH